MIHLHVNIEYKLCGDCHLSAYDVGATLLRMNWIPDKIQSFLGFSAYLTIKKSCLWNYSFENAQIIFQGNILDLTDGRIGLLDYGQAKRLQPCEYIALAKVLIALRDGNEDSVADAMRELGFRSKLDRSDILAQTAAFYFDSDEVFEKLGYNNNKAFMEHLQKVDPMIVVPDAAGE